MFIFSGFTWSVFICSLTDLRGCSGGVVGALRLTRFLPLVLPVVPPAA
ncbi:hypothetical protein [Tropheryma whipplei]|nr:hypothetical protein [Tropheryma whipplei]